jgi:hypothetical protein
MSVIAAAIIGSAVVGGIAAEGPEDAAYANTQAQSAAASESTKLGRERLDFEKKQYEEGKVNRDRVTDRAIAVSDAQLASQKQNDALSKEYADYQRNTFRPLEQGIVSDAAGFDTPEKRQAAADAAMADVNKGFSAVNSARARQLAAEGVDPGSTRAMSVMQGQDVDQALGNASAARASRRSVAR